MTDQDYRNTIAQNWLLKAEDAYETASLLLREKRFVGCVNRLYYAVFYAVSAALAKDGKEYGKHTAVRAALHRDYVKTEKIPPECSKIYDELFEDRQEGDYKPQTNFDEADIRKLFVDTRTFLNHFKAIL